MKDVLKEMENSIHQDHRRKRRTAAVFAVLALLVAGTVNWNLHQTGISKTAEPECGMEEHTHSDACYETVLVCGQEEGEADPGHTHTEECYETQRTLTCTLEEHTHDENCYDEEGNLICEKTEHTHTEECYTEENVLICEEEERPAAEGHIHTDTCYEKTLVCEKTEHTHSVECYSDDSADVETSEQWEATLPADLTGIWADDLLSVARSQLGYTESTRNWVLGDDGTTEYGYSRYGDWYGSAYGDWCAMFVSFCLHYTGIPESTFPEGAGCQAWIAALKEMNLYQEASAYTPVKGDLVFFDWNLDGTADHVGIVESTGTDTIATIEGNISNGTNDAVREEERSLTDGTVIGYGVLPANPENPEEITLTATADDGVVVTIRGLASSFPYPAEEITVTATVVHDETQENIISEAMSSEGRTAESTTLYDVCLWHNEEEFEPIGAVTLSFSGAAEKEDSVSVYHIDEETQTAEDMNAEVQEDGTVELGTDHFSTYAVAVQSANGLSGNAIGAGSSFTTANVNGKTVYLTNDITVSGTVAISSDTTVDLNGHKIYVTADPLFNVTGGALTIQDSGVQSFTKQVVESGNEDSDSQKTYGNAASYSAVQYSNAVALTNAATDATGIYGDGAVSNLIDGNYTSSNHSKFGCSQTSGTVTVTFQANSAFVPAGYSIVSANDTATNTGRTPKSWKLYGSNDQSTWTELSSVTGMNADNFTEHFYGIEPILNTADGSCEYGSYQYFKIEFETGSSGLQVEELRMYSSVSGGLTYYVTDPVVSSGTGATTDTLYQYTVYSAGMIIGDGSGRAITTSDGTLNLAGGYICNFGEGSSEYCGGAIKAENCTINLTGTVIAANKVDISNMSDSDKQSKMTYKNYNRNGGGIYLNNSTLNMSGGVITGNTLNIGKGDRHWDETYGNVYELTFYGGAGIYSVDSNINLSGGYITNNRFEITGSKYFEGGGGVLLDGTSVLTMTSGYITGNYSEGGGGGIKTSRNNGSKVVMSGGFLSNNHANGAEGGGAAFDRDGVGYFTGGYITNNTYYVIGGTAGDWGGGGLYCSDGSSKNEPGKIFLQNSLITENTAGGFGGGIAGCSTGRIYVCVEEGGAIFNNTAWDSEISEKPHLSGDGSSKSDDHLAYEDSVFMANGFEDYFCALTSSVDGGMLGGGSAEWTGSSDGFAVSTTSTEDVLSAASRMGLTAHPSSTDQSNAASSASLFINGNDSYVHGGGVLANGYLLVGNPDEIDVPARLELSGTKSFLDESGKAADATGKTFKFEIKDSTDTVISTGTTDESLAITFANRISFEEAGSFSYYISEVTDDTDGTVLYDTTVYRLDVTTVKEQLDSLVNAKGKEVKRYQIKFTKIELYKKTASDSDYVKCSDFDTTIDNDEQHAVKKSLSSSSTFTNYEISKMKYVVKKIWADGSDGKNAITVQLYRNNQAYGDPVTLDSSSGWEHTWNDLDVKDSDGNSYSYSVKETAVSGYIAQYSYASSYTTGSSEKTVSVESGNYWVPVQPGETLVSGTEYAIVSADYTTALAAVNHTNDRLDTTDYISLSDVSQGKLTVNNVEYSSWIPASQITGTGIWVIDSKTTTPNKGAVVFKTNSSNVWLANESDVQIKTTSGGGIQYGSRIKWENGYLMMQQGMLNNANSNSYRYVVIGDTGTDAKYKNNFMVSNDSTNAVHLYKMINISSATTATVTESTGAVATTTATITNTPVGDVLFKLNIHKVDDTETRPLKGAKFKLLDSSGNALKFTLTNGVYKPDTNGSEELLVSAVTGYIHVIDLPGGTYTLRETEAPAGYGRAADQIIDLSQSTDGETFNITVIDPEGAYELPETGGSGTFPYTAAGSVLMIGALLYGYSMRRRRGRGCN